MIESSLPLKELAAVTDAVVKLFTAALKQMKPKDRGVLAQGLAQGLLRPRFVLEADGSALGEVVLPNGEKITVFQRVSPAAVQRDTLN